MPRPGEARGASCGGVKAGEQEAGLGEGELGWTCALGEGKGKTRPGWAWL